MMNYQNQISLEVIFQVLSSPVRLQILELLASGTRCVNCIADETGLNQPTVSQHLRVLRMAGLVLPVKEGKFVHYSVCGESIDLICEFLRKLSEMNSECVCSKNHQMCHIQETPDNGGKK